MARPLRISDWLLEMRAAGIELRAEGGKLICSSPEGALTPDDLRMLRDRKAEILEFLDRAGSGPTRRGSLPSLLRRPVGEPLPLSHAQERAWFIEQIQPGCPMHNIPGGWRLTGPLDVFERSLREISRRHEIMRSAYRGEPASPYVEIAPPDTLDLHLEDLTDTPPVQREGELQHRLAREVHSPFDIGTAPLVRHRLFRLERDVHAYFIMPHHMIWDAWSFDIFWGELSQLYDAFSRGLESPLPELPVQYTDYAAWERELDRLGASSDDLEFWLSELVAPLPILELPTDFDRPDKMSYRGSSVTIPLPDSLMDRLSELARAEQATVFMASIAALDVLLCRLSGQDEVCIGCPIENTLVPEVEPLIGYFVNMLVLRGFVRQESSFRELLVETRECCVAAFDHPAAPFDRLLTELDIKRDRSRNPLFQVLFLYQDATTRPLTLGESVRIDQFDVPMGSCQADLHFALKRSSAGWYLIADYSSDLFRRDTALSILDRLVALLHQVVANPDAPILELEIEPLRETVGGKVREQTALADPACRAQGVDRGTLHGLIERQAGSTPDHVAARFPGGSPEEEARDLTYAELDDRANQVARYLAGRGIGPGDVVVVAMDRGPDLLISLLGVLKSGACYVPVDPLFPPERIKYMLEDSKARLLLTETSLEERIGTTDVPTLCVDEHSEAILSVDRHPLHLQVDSRARAYVIYTSGSTGKPKGVEIEHASLHNFLTSMAREPGFGPEDRILAVTTASFDIAVLELYLPLICGGQVVVAAQTDAVNPDRISHHIDRFAITVMQATATTWGMLIDSGWGGAPGLRVFCGGEAMTARLAAELLLRCREVWNLYGPTETTVWSSVARVTDAGDVSIGRPIDRTEFLILDEGMRPVSVGETGELYIGGDGLARGYLGRPELTAQRFVPNPLSPQGESRLYRTGDLARQRADGSFEWYGRTDHQIKLRGFRIELGEIEAALQAMEPIEQAVVGVWEPSPGDQRLVAYYRSPEEVPATRLRAGLRDELPEYMVPGFFVRLESFPLTPNAKIDRNALPAPEALSIQTSRNFGQADAAVRWSDGDPLEERLTAVWRRVLKVDDVPWDVDFFDLGGHSILGLQLVTQIRNELRIQLDPVTFFDHPTIHQLARQIRSSSAPESPAEPSSEDVELDSAEAAVQANTSSCNLDRVSEAIGAAGEQSRKTRYRMRRSLIARFLLAPLYGIPRHSLRSLIQYLILRLEGGPLFSRTLRALYRKHHDMVIGDYTSFPFDVRRFKRGTRFGRYCSVHATARIETANHPTSTLSSNAIFYHPDLGFAEGYDLPRTSVRVGNDVWIGADAAILYPCEEIGDGAVIGAGAYVTFNVPPFAVVIGHPATIVRYRFPKKKINEILDARWWEASLEELKPVAGEFVLPVSSKRIR